MLRFLICGFVFIFSGAVYAASPIVVEFFGQNSCQSDTDIQEQFVSLLEKHDDLIIVNCRQWFEPDASRNESAIFSHKFCSDRARAYKKRLLERAVIVVNGRWSANIKQIDPAIKLARLDAAKSVGVTLNDRDKTLNLDLPDLGRSVDAKIYVFSYAPTQGDFAYRVDPDLELTNELRARMQSGESVPFVTRVEKSQYLFRPVLGQAFVGTWDGGATQISYSLSDLLTFSMGVPTQDISYAVVVHEDDSLGPVLASGETISIVEQAYLLPRSEPLNIERMSEGDPNLTVTQ